MILKLKWILFGFLLFSIVFASKFCKKYKNHPLCTKHTAAKPIISTTETPSTIDLATNCEINCSDIGEEIDQVCAISINGDIQAFVNECEMEKYSCENDQNFTKIDERFCEEPTCLNLGSPVCIRMGFRHYVLLENECAVQLYSCQFNANKLNIVANEKCDANLPICSDGPCVHEFLPICGINRDKIYHLFANDCQLRRHNCEFKETYRPTSIEHCDKDAENELCDHESCPPTDDPVCGQNSKKKRKYFSNLCHLDNYNCKNDNEFALVPIAECQQGCQNTNGTDCDEGEELCAFNDVEHKWFNCEKEMNAFNCKKRKNFRSIAKTQCHCLLHTCGQNDSNICATSGITSAIFKSYCDLQSSTKCGLKNQLVPVNRIFCEDSGNACDIEKDVECLNIYYPVCAIGKDKLYKWYNSPCSLFASNCQDKNDAVIVDSNYCKGPFSLERCHSELCDYRYNPVCGEDSKTNQTLWFGNACSIRHFNCFFEENYEAVDITVCGNVTTIDSNGNI